MFESLAQKRPLEPRISSAHSNCNSKGTLAHCVEPTLAATDRAKRLHLGQPS